MFMEVIFLFMKVISGACNLYSCLERFFLYIGILIFLLVRSPYKFSETYHNPFWCLEQRYQEEEEQDKRTDKSPNLVFYLSCSTGKHLKTLDNT
jgi:hypothetical protein